VRRPCVAFPWTALLLAVGGSGTGACGKSAAPPGPTEGQTAAAVGAPDGFSSPVGDSSTAIPAPAGAGVPTVPPGPEPPPRSGCVGTVAKRIPESPDPLGGAFPLDEALKDLPGDGPALAATLDTSAGRLRCTLDMQAAPLTVANFVGLARGLRPWWDPCRGAWVREPLYDGTSFFRLQPGFVAQAGCPIGDGTGGPGYAVPDELRPELRHDAAGILSMASLGPDTAGSQFFVTLAPALELDRQHTVFGRCGPAETLARLDEAARDGTAVRIRRVTFERFGE